MRSIALLIVLLFAVSFLFAAGEKANFAGTWTLNEEKTNLGEGGRWMLTTKMIVTQEENKMTLERVIKRRSGEESTVTEVLTLDGKECQNNLENRQKTSTAVWSADGKNLTVSSKTVFEREGNKMEMTSVEIWKYSDDGKTLLVDSTSQSPRGERKVVYVYEKK
jgi:hypothetical protein